VSRERVHQIEVRAFEKVQKAVRNRVGSVACCGARAGGGRGALSGIPRYLKKSHGRARPSSNEYNNLFSPGPTSRAIVLLAGRKSRKRYGVVKAAYKTARPLRSIVSNVTIKTEQSP
jgi:hypothetical protein